jgi:TMEM175 potassium channel family protein
LPEHPRRQHQEQTWLERRTEAERTVFFSDAVFAIAITLLALELRVPEIPTDPASGQELAAKLLELWPGFVSFVLSFWLVGSYWIAHHRHFRYLRGYDRRVLVVNLLFLMWVVLVPFSTSLLGEYGHLQIAADTTPPMGRWPG